MDNDDDFSDLNGSQWVKLLIEEPELADECAWEKLNGEDWATLLSERADFASMCECADWEKLEGGDWQRLLIKRPEFADKCDWDKLEGDDWTSLLMENPDFANRCNWGKLDGGDWSRLLCQRPDFADRCVWEKLGGYAWASLLAKRPEFADRCDWDKLVGFAWADLLAKRPEFADKCAWDKLDGWDWERLLKSQPQFESRKVLSGWDWVRKLSVTPQLADKCEWEKLDGWDWAKLLSNKPQFAEKCIWEKMNNGDWAFLLERQPQFVEKRESMGMKPLLHDSENGVGKESNMDSESEKIYVGAVVRSHGVCFYPDVEDVKRLIEDNEPVPNQFFHNPFPEGYDSCFIGRCTITFENEDGDECYIVYESNLTKSLSITDCEYGEFIDLSQVEIVENGAKVDPLEKLDEKDGVPVEYAQEERQRRYSFSINEKFDPRKLTLVVENGFLVGIQYCGSDVVTAADIYNDGDYLCDMYSIEYRYLDNGHIDDGFQEIMI